MGESNEFNVLLLSESFKGKSTFINAVANYLSFNSYEEAKKSPEFVYLIPDRFEILDGNYEYHMVEFGRAPGAATTESENENEKFAADNLRAYTVDCTSYVFPIGGDGAQQPPQWKLRLIDSPGFRGIPSLDDETTKKILQVMAHYGRLHAILVFSDYWDATFFPDLLTGLVHKNGHKNISFVLSNVDRYSKTELRDFLKLAIDGARQHTNKIAIRDNNTYDIGNIGFFQIASMRNGSSIRFSGPQEERASNHWQESSNQLLRMVEHVVSGKTAPHDVKETLGVHKELNIVPKAPLEVVFVPKTKSNVYKDLTKLKVSKK